MALLPVDLRQFAVPDLLPSGRFWPVPIHYDDREARRLADLVGSLWSVVHYQIELRWDMLPLQKALLSPEQTLALVFLPAGISPQQRDQRFDALQVRGLLYLQPEPQHQGVGWMEKYFKGPLLRISRRHVESGDHPLAELGVADLPFGDASELSADGLEVLKLLEGVLAHRLCPANAGLSGSDPFVTLREVAASYLVERLLRLSSRERELALEALLACAVGRRLALGATLLERIGLGRYLSGTLFLAPLSDQISDPIYFWALHRSLPADSWSRSARQAFERLRPPGPAPFTSGLLPSLQAEIPGMGYALQLITLALERGDWAGAEALLGEADQEAIQASGETRAVIAALLAYQHGQARARQGDPRGAFDWYGRACEQIQLGASSRHPARALLARRLEPWALEQGLVLLAQELAQIADGSDEAHALGGDPLSAL